MARAPILKTWQTAQIAIDPTVDWHMLRMGHKGTEADCWMMALLELKPGVGATGIELCKFPDGSSPLGRSSQKLWMKNIRVHWLHVGKDNRFITAHITPRFLKLLQDENPACAKLLTGLVLCRDADALPGTAGQIAGIREGILLPSGSVLLGIIDDQLPLAHRRFRSNDEDTGFPSTRWRHLWFQGDYNVGGIPPHYGYFLSQKAVNNTLKYFGRTEDHAITEFNRLKGDSSHRLMGRAAHGFSVADLLAGFEPDDPAGKARPLIGVQLPKPMVMDSSGLSMAAYVFDALKFILQKAQDVFDKQVKEQQRLPIVVNLSYGITQGPHDGSSMLERALTYCIDTYNARTPSTPVCLVLPAGNALEMRGHAVLPPVGAPKTDTLEWRVLPDDATSSFVEIWWSAGSSGESLTVTLPDGKTRLVVDAANPIAELHKGTLCTARIQLFPADPALGRSRTQALIALAPSAASLSRNEPMGAPHGRWAIRVGGASKSQPVHAWISRDDTVFGTQRGGRQSRFEDAAYLRRETHDRRPALDNPVSSIQRGGAFNGIATSSCENIVAIGGSIATTQGPSGYSGSGYPLAGPAMVIRGPDIVATSDDSSLRSGVLASGLRSGAFIALNGTSMAAPQVGRALANALSARVRVPTSAKIMVKNLVPAPGKYPFPSPEMGEGAAIISADARLEALHALRRK